MKKLRAILTGCGSIADAWLKAASGFDDLEICALADIDIEAARKLRQKFALKADCFASLENALNSVAVDAVFDCTVPKAHKSITLKALEHNCHVLGEKPISDNLADALQMVQAAQNSGYTYAVIQNRRYDENIITFKELIQSGQIGELTTLNADFYIGAHFGGFRDEMEDVLLSDMAIHTFDAARFISGQNPVSVYCKQFNPKGSWYKGCASAVAIFEFTGGVVFNYRGSWCAEGLNTSWESDWRAVGTDGSAVWDGFDRIEAEKPASNEGFLRPQRQIEVSPSQIENKGHSGVIREFLDCIKTGKTPQTICDDNIKSFAMVCAAVESSKTGKVIEIENMLKGMKF